MLPSSTAAKARAFVEKWERVSINEKAVAQSHFNELCDLLGQPNPIQADPAGKFYRFEKPLTKSGGGAGFADVWRRDRFAWEYKSKGKRLDDAYRQLLLYRSDLDNPPVLVACNIAEYNIHIEFTGHKSRVERFRNEDLATVQFRELLELVFTDPEQLRPAERTETVTTKAAARFAKVAQLLEGRGYAPIEVAPFFMQLLFALFAEDVHLLPNQLLSNNIKEAILRPAEFADRTRALFRAMRDGGYFGVSKVPRFNGGLFERDVVLPLNADELTFLYEAAKLDWKDIEPSIFGTLLERSFDPAKRSQLGMHYTSEADILEIVEPVLMHPLRREWSALRARLETMAPQLALAQGMARQQAKNHMERAVFDFIERLGELQVLDAACGSGNFLYVALKRLKDFEKEIAVYCAGLGLEPPDLVVHPRQFHGIEKSLYAAELAQVVVWFGYLQWKRTNGFWDVQDPILDHLQVVECRDAILTVDHEGQPAQPEWPAAHVIIGNPPFLGGKRLRAELGDAYVDSLFALYKGQVPHEADLVTYWFERARKMIADGHTKRAGLIATQGIRGGANRKVLEHIKATGDIFMAWSDRKWVLDGAAVQVSMVGFDIGLEEARVLDGRPVATINANLTSIADVTLAQRLTENSGIAFMGDTKGGAFDLPPREAQLLLEAPNANGRSNSDVVVPWINGLDITRRPRGMYIIDFGVDMPEAEAAGYERPYKHVQQAVQPERLKNKRAAYRDRWWIHVEPRPALRRALRPLPRFIATPNLTKHRLFAWVTPPTLPDHQLIVFARDDDYFFGVLHSRAHELWARATGTQLREAESGCRYTPTSTFETFPFPWAPGHEPANTPLVEAIAAAARDLVSQRDAWLDPAEVFGVDLKQRTLTNLYNKRPDWLVEAHHRLDCAVCDAYGWPHDITDGEILEHLLALNLARSTSQTPPDHADAEEAVAVDELVETDN